MNPRQIAAIVIVALSIVFFPVLGYNLWETLDASEVMVVQSIRGELTWHTTPGIKWQGWGSITKYPKRSQFWFSSKGEQGRKVDESVKIQFNDGGHAQISGSLSWEVPLDNDHLTLIHTHYGSSEALEHQMIRTNLEKSVYLSGPMMSSAQSYAERKNELLGIIEDQFLRGVYKTSSKDERITDPITGIGKTVKSVEAIKGTDGQFERQEESPIVQHGIKAFNFSINDVKYEPVVEAQIKQQQESIMAVQSAIAKTKTAEQDVLTYAKTGEANATKAEWAQKELMATAVTLAEQEKQVALTAASKELEVAQLMAQAAEQVKLAKILEGEGEATKQKLVMDANGALEKKLEAWVRVQEYYANAIGQYQGNWVPGVVMAGGGGDVAGAHNGATDLIALLTAQTARQLKLDTEIPEKGGTLPHIKRPDASKYQFKKLSEVKIPEKR